MTDRKTLAIMAKRGSFKASARRGRLTRFRRKVGAFDLSEGPHNKEDFVLLPPPAPPPLVALIRRVCPWPPCESVACGSPPRQGGAQGGAAAKRHAPRKNRATARRPRPPREAEAPQAPCQERPGESGAARRGHASPVPARKPAWHGGCFSIGKENAKPPARPPRNAREPARQRSSARKERAKLPGISGRLSGYEVARRGKTARIHIPRAGTRTPLPRWPIFFGSFPLFPSTIAPLH